MSDDLEYLEVDNRGVEPEVFRYSAVDHDWPLFLTSLDWAACRHADSVPPDVRNLSVSDLLAIAVVKFVAE